MEPQPKNWSYKSKRLFGIIIHVSQAFGMWPTYITSAKWLGDWGRKMAIFTDVQYVPYWPNPTSNFPFQ